MHVLYVLSFMIERVGSGIRPHVGALSSYLPALWQQSEVYSMLRCAIVSTLIHLEKVNICVLLIAKVDPNHRRLVANIAPLIRL